MSNEPGWARTTRDGKVIPEPVEVPLTARHRAMMAVGAIEPDLHRYQMGDCTVLVGIGPQTGWHISISCPDRYPTWDEIAKARYTLCPEEVMMVMYLPPPWQYVNAHPNCFHLHEDRSTIVHGER
jgi:hypothetical protein